MESLVDRFKAWFKNASPEEKEQMREFFKDNTPKGWVSIDEHLPQWKASDFFKGHSVYKVRNKDGEEFDTQVTDHNMWYRWAKKVGITHWLNE